jgi:thiol-disulfide isomerase/thioredoxin
MRDKLMLTGMMVAGAALVGISLFALLAEGPRAEGEGAHSDLLRTASVSGLDEAVRDLDLIRPPRPKQASDFSVSLLGGETLKLKAQRGKPVMVNFWATWCAPCVRELPALQRFQRDRAAQGWRVVALAVDQPVPVLEFISRFKLDLTVAMAGIEGLEWQRLMGNPSGGLPFSLLFDDRGRTRQRRLGESSYQDLVHWADEIGQPIAG